MKKDFKLIFSNQDGIALMLVMTAIVLLTAIMMAFSIDSNINKIKSYNIEDRGQAKLNAESGVQFAMVRLQLYAEAFNYVENNSAVKDFATPEVLNSIWNFPFIFPIPVNEKMNMIQKNAIDKFHKNTLIQGSMKLIITNISNKVNLNLLRVSLMSTITNEGDPPEDPPEDGDEEYEIANQLIKTLNYSIEKKSENDEDFMSNYMGSDTLQMINNLKVYISDPDSLEDDGGALGEFAKIDSEPKMSPFSSMSEMYSIPGWVDDMVELVTGEYTVHGAVMIDLNKITEKMLRILLPDITDEEVKEFFEYRDDPEDPKYFNKVDDFKSYVVNIGNILPEKDFDERFAKFEKQGLKFGPSPSLFKVVAAGQKGRAVYTLTAYVTIPAKPLTSKTSSALVSYIVKTYKEDNPGDDLKDITLAEMESIMDGYEDEDFIDNLSDDEKADILSQVQETKDEKEQKTQLLKPRIVEIFVS